MIKQNCAGQFVLIGILLATSTLAAPIQESWPVDAADDSVAAAAAALSGWYAIADSFDDNVEIRDVGKELIRTISRSEISGINGLLPWMTLDVGQSGPCGLAFSNSGRLLFILVCDDELSDDGHPSDAILRYDVFADTLSVFTRVELFARGNAPHLSVVHCKGRLYVGTSGDGIIVYSARANDVQSIPLYSIPIAAGSLVHGLAVDRDAGFLYAASSTTIYRADLSIDPLTTNDFIEVGAISNIRAITFGDHYGGSDNSGLYVLESTSSPEFYQLHHVPVAQARGNEPFAPTVYLSGSDDWHDVVATADGRLLVGADEDGVLIRDDTDTRLLYLEWLSDEFNEVVKFTKSLILPDDSVVPDCPPDNEPANWVIDTNVDEGKCRLHPATADGAAWTILLLLMNRHINGDPAAQSMIGEILVRYAGLAADGIMPALCPNGDGQIMHWIEPATGCLEPGGWPEEFAVLSTMKLVAAAARAMAFFPNDPIIQQAGHRIICRVRNWDNYIQPGTDALYLVCPPAVAVKSFFEGIIFVEQAATYGGLASMQAFQRWLDRSLWPTAEFIVGKPVTGNVPGQFQAAFLSLYPLLLSKPYRENSEWLEQIGNLLCSNAAWTDDNCPRLYTVFSAGTTKPEWSVEGSGYSADNLGHHPGDITTIPSLMAFSATGETAASVSAYHAYRLGARQTFAGGASILYRRSEVDTAYDPNSASLPDVVLGALGLAELLQAGSVDAVLALPYSPLGDLDGDGVVDPIDLRIFVDVLLESDTVAAHVAGSDLNCDGFVDGDDIQAFAAAITG